MTKTPPVVICVRDPDADNSYNIFGGTVLIHDIDLGRADLDSLEEFLGWAEAHLEEANLLPADAGTYVHSVVWQEYMLRRGSDWPQVDDPDALLAATKERYA